MILKNISKDLPMKKILATGLLFLSLNVFSQEVKIHVTLSPAGSFQATSDKVSGRVIKKEGILRASRITVPVDSFKTEIDLRDEHFKKHLKMKDHSRAILKKMIGQNGNAKGVLEVAGVDKPIAIKYQEKGNLILATFTVKASDFKLDKAQYMGVGVEDQVKVDVKIPFTTAK